MKFLVTGAVTCADRLLEYLTSAGKTAVFMQNESDRLPCDYSEVEAVFCNGLFLHHPIERFTNLRYIQLSSAGLDRVPLEHIKTNGIKIHNARGVYSLPMAEFVLCGVLCLLKRMAVFADRQKQHKWEKCRDIAELYGKRVCIVGCGSVGYECAVRFGAMGCEVTGVDIAPYDGPAFCRIYPIERLDEVIARSDICILTLPLTGATRHLFGKERLDRMKTGAVLVNISRGGIVDTKALTAALQTGRLSGAVLDVFETEPLEETSPLWDMENVLLTPHNSFVGEGNQKRLFDSIITNLREEGL